ncbi:phage minor head protein [Aneurinibacillus thermoaerophilus]|nr:phage minor head protein [Aneurinibacillus thermoaerophilus]
MAVEKSTDKKSIAIMGQMVDKLAEVIKKVGKESIELLKSDRGTYYSPDMFSVALDLVMAHYEEEFAEIMTEFNVEAAQLGQNRIIHHLQVMGFSLTHAPITDRVLELIKEQTFEASKNTLANIKGDVMDNIADSYRQGLGIDDAAKRLEEVFENMKEHQLKRIARTEINGNLQKGAHETMNELNIEYTQWISADDSRTRRSHKELNGQITKRNGKYSNGLEHPGDRRGPTEEWINCRCREVPYFIPKGYAPPPGRDWFYEKDLIKISH